MSQNDTTYEYYLAQLSRGRGNKKVLKRYWEVSKHKDELRFRYTCTGTDYLSLSPDGTFTVLAVPSDGWAQGLFGRITKTVAKAPHPVGAVDSWMCFGPNRTKHRNTLNPIRFSVTAYHTLVGWEDYYSSSNSRSWIDYRDARRKAICLEQDLPMTVGMKIKDRRCINPEICTEHVRRVDRKAAKAISSRYLALGKVARVSARLGDGIPLVWTQQHAWRAVIRAANTATASGTEMDYFKSNKFDPECPTQADVGSLINLVLEHSHWAIPYNEMANKRVSTRTQLKLINNALSKLRKAQYEAKNLYSYKLKEAA